MSTRNLFTLVWVLFLSGCTTIGLPNHAKLQEMDFGEPETIHLCIIRDTDVSPERVDEVIEILREEFIQYGISIEVPWIRIWDRPGFTYKTIMSDVVTVPLHPPCDRLFALVDRNAGDFLWGLIFPEVLGAVDELTHTKGFSVAEWGSLNQLIVSQNSTAIHETYHLLGCAHDIIKDKCYDQIRHLKHEAAQERKTGNDFFPSISRDGKILRTRNEVDNELYQFFLNSNK